MPYSCRLSSRNCSLPRQRNICNCSSSSRRFDVKIRAKAASSTESVAIASRRASMTTGSSANGPYTNSGVAPSK